LVSHPTPFNHNDGNPKGWHNLYKIETDNHKVTATGNHPFLVSNEKNSTDSVWSSPFLLQVGDEVYVESGKLEKIIFIEKLEEEEYTYNLEVNDIHTYIADGFRVHNAYRHPKQDPMFFTNYRDGKRVRFDTKENQKHSQVMKAGGKTKPTIFNKKLQPPKPQNKVTMRSGGRLRTNNAQQHGGNARWGRMSMGDPGRVKPLTRGGAKSKVKRKGGALPRPNRKLQYGGSTVSQRTCGGPNQAACPKSFRRGGNTIISGTSGFRRGGATSIGLSTGRNAGCRQYDGNETMCKNKNCIFNYSERTCN